METTTATGSTATRASLTPSFPTRPSGRWFPPCTRLTVARPSVATRSWREAADAPKTVARIPSWRYNDSLILAANRTLSVEESMPLDFIIVRGAREMTAGARVGCGTVGTLVLESPPATGSSGGGQRLMGQQQELVHQVRG